MGHAAWGHKALYLRAGDTYAEECSVSYPHAQAGNRHRKGAFFRAGTMTGRPRKRIYLCEKRPELQAMLETALPPEEALISGFSGYQECLEALAAKPCDLLIVDLDGCARDGLSMLEQARRIAPWIRTLAIVGHADVPCAIQAIKAGAGDCLDKPVPADGLLRAVEAQLAQVVAARRRPRAMTPMEVQILQMILAGKTSYDMADELQRSKRTIDVHRKNIMCKLHATGLVDLIKRALGMGFVEPPDPGPDEHPADQSGRESTDRPPPEPPDDQPGQG